MTMSMSQLFTTSVATDKVGAGMRPTKAFAVGEKSLLCTESRCPAKRRTLWPDCRESLSYRDEGQSRSLWSRPSLWGYWPK